MIPLRYKDGGIVRGVVQTTEQLGSVKDTVLDPHVETNGGHIELPVRVLDYANRRIDSVFVPPFGAVREGNIIVLSRVQTAAQMLLIMIDQFKNGQAKEKQLQRSLTGYQLAIMRLIFGRSGFISEYLMCNRMQRSGRAVLLPKKGGNPFECTIPSWMAKKIGIREGQLVLVGRDPTIWDGSIEIFRARLVNEDVIRLHPFVFGQLNADCDGDQVWCLAIPKYLQADMEVHLGGFMRRHATWPKPWNYQGKEIQWETCEDELVERCRPDGFSVGPEDIMFETSVAEKGQEILDKEVLNECRKTALGLTFKEWQEIMLEVNESMLTMKVGMGPVGAGAMNLRILAQDSKLCVNSACAMAERLEQLLLDAKRAKNIDGPTYSADDALDILNKRNTFVGLEEPEAVTKLSAMLGLKPSVVRPMVKIIWREGTGLSALVRNAYPMFASTQQAADNKDVALALATELFYIKNIDRSGVARFIIDTLREVSIKRKEAQHAE